jgi:hypothetical protein
MRRSQIAIIERVCQLAKVSRAGLDRYMRGRAPVEECMTVRSAVQEITLKHRRRYVYRRVTAVGQALTQKFCSQKTIDK